MHLIVGLGNHGKGYAGNRHNIGFMAIESIARAHSFPGFRSRFQALVSEGTLGGERVMLMMPQTWMNESGRAVGEALRFYKLDEKDVTVIHDELDLPAARARLKTGGGNAGHNGLKSIAAHIGGDFRRLRLGIGHPGDKNRVHDYVLSDFAKAEESWVEALTDAIARNAHLLTEGPEASFLNKVHLAMDAAGFGEKKKEPKAREAGTKAQDSTQDSTQDSAQDSAQAKKTSDAGKPAAADKPAASKRSSGNGEG
ncbi:MAG: aminoacyl-tRNA hydrolase [Alphaproteobacteria bacterium]|nr:aminoacyl-tRNA hydrolase [Alphaproteobacteria bacterium]